MKQQIFILLAYFIIYSILGWIMESIFRSISEKKIINTGFLKGPFCPIYGIGAIIMILFLQRFQSNMILLFIIAMVTLTLWEYLVAVILEGTFHIKYWDYSKNKFNFQGRICLTNSIYWGVLGVVFICYIHSFMESKVMLIPDMILKISVCGIMIIVLADAINTIVRLKNLKSTLEKIENLNAQIKEKLNELKELKETKGLKEIIAGKEQKEAKKLKKQKALKELEKSKEWKELQNSEESHSSEEIDLNINLQKVIQELDKKRQRILLRLYKRVSRLKKAFPTIDSKEIAEILNKKIELNIKKKDIIKVKNNKE